MRKDTRVLKIRNNLISEQRTFFKSLEHFLNKRPFQVHTEDVECAHIQEANVTV